MSRFLVTIAVVIPVLILSSLILLLVDNFTYTVFEFGMVSTERLSRAAYGFLFLLLCSFAFYKFSLYIRSRHAKKYPLKRSQWILLAGLLSVSGILSLFSMMTSRAGLTPVAAASPRDRLPNIILLGSDGLDVTRLSAYGYERDTTPSIKKGYTERWWRRTPFPMRGRPLAQLPAS